MFVQKNLRKCEQGKKQYSELLIHFIHCDGGLITFNILLVLECNESFASFPQSVV